MSTRGWSGALRAGPPQTGHSPSSSSGQLSACSTNVDLDKLAGDLVAQCTSDGFQLRELGASRKTLGIKFLRQFPSNLAQACVEFLCESRRHPCPCSRPFPNCGPDRVRDTDFGRKNNI